MLAAAVACTYFLVAQVGFALVNATGGVGVLWPASGLAVGALVASPRRARAAVAVGLLAAATGTYLTGTQGILTPVWLGLCAAGEAVLAAWLVERWSGRCFAFADVRGLWGFLAAAALAAMAAALCATVALLPFHAAAALPGVWREWATADAIGIVTVAPLVVGLQRLAGERLSGNEVLEGAGALALLAATSVAAYVGTGRSWQVPPPLLFPILLWIAGRCRPVFAAAAALILTAALAASTAFRLGPAASDAMSVLSIQVSMIIGSLCALILAALFAERRRSEAAVMESNERLRLALSGAQLGVWSVDLLTDEFESDPRDRIINGHDLKSPPQTLAEARKYIHPDDLGALDAAFRAARQTGAPCRAEYRVRIGASLDPAHVSWVAVEGNVVRDETGRAVRLMGVTRNITERKLAEQALAERTAQLALAGQAGLVGTYVYDIASDMVEFSTGFAAIYGLPEGTTQIRRTHWRACIHPDDGPAFDRQRASVLANRQREMLWEFRIRRPDGEVRWIEMRSIVGYDDNGVAQRVVGVHIDVTARKRDEEHQRLLVAELDHRVKNVLAVVSALVARTRETSGSLAETVTALDGRIKSMATAHELLSRRRWHGLSLRDLIERELEPYAGDGNVEVDGPDVMLRAEAGQALAMVVHELATNAAKYGALSGTQGRVSVRWRCLPENGSSAVLALEWIEAGGPPVGPTSRVGYGTSVIRDLIPYELGGTVDLQLAADGARCRLRIPAKWLSAAGDRAAGARLPAIVRASTA